MIVCNLDPSSYFDLLPTSWFTIVTKHPEGLHIGLDAYLKFREENPPTIYYDKPKDPRVKDFMESSVYGKYFFLKTYDLTKINPYIYNGYYLCGIHHEGKPDSYTYIDYLLDSKLKLRCEELIEHAKRTDPEKFRESESESEPVESEQSEPVESEQSEPVESEPTTPFTFDEPITPFTFESEPSELVPFEKSEEMTPFTFEPNEPNESDSNEPNESVDERDSREALISLEKLLSEFKM